MKTISLQRRFIIAGFFLLAFMVACGAWSVLTFDRLGAALVRTLDKNQATINLAVEIIYTLEREDDAILFALTNGAKQGAAKLTAERGRFEQLYRQLAAHVHSAEDEKAYAALRKDADAYRQASDSLLSRPEAPDVFQRYSSVVNPILGHSIADARHFRQSNVDAMRVAGINIERDSRRSSVIVGGLTLAALLSSVGVIGLLTRSVTRPIGELNRAVEALRDEKLAYRVPVRSSDELGQLAVAFNHMAESLEKSRRAAEDRFRQLAENINEIFWMTDLPGEHVLYISPGYEEVWGRSLQSLYDNPRSWLENVYKDDLVAVLSNVEQRSQGTFSDIEFRIVRPDNTMRWIRNRAFPLEDATGTNLRIAGLTEDITARKRAEEDVRRANERMELAVRGTQMCIWEFDMPDGCIENSATTFVNVWESMGYDPAEAPADAPSALALALHPDELERVLANVRDCLSGVNDVFEMKNRVVTKTGSVRWNLSRGVVLRDPTGKPTRFIGTGTDITDLIRAEEALRDSEQRFRMFADHATDAFFLLDEELKLLDVNREACVSLGYTREELMDMTPLDFDPDVTADDLNDIQQQLRDGKIVAFESRHRRKDGTMIPVEVRGQSFWEGERRFTVALARDITERKRAMEALQQAKDTAESANRAKDEFLANVSHEIRTPMNAILGMTELVLDTPLSEDQRQSLHTVKSAADNLLAIINDLLDFSRIEAGKIKLNHDDFSLRTSLGDTLRALAVRAHRKGLELVSHVQPDVPDSLVGDAGRLRQVILNLVGNAIKFTDEGEVVVRVSISEEQVSKEGVVLNFAVSDTGIGIPKNKQAKIFRAFEQEDSSTTRKYGGTGLGLTIAEQIVELMGGHISVESEVGRGSMFTFTARFDVSSKAAPSKPPQPVVLLKDLRVLVVDDNATNRHILAEYLRNWQLDPVAVGDGVSALGALWEGVTSNQPFGLVMLDARMPDTDGLAIAEMIRKRADLSSTRLILLTSGDRPGDISRYRELKIDAHLLKPVQQEELLDTIYRVMQSAGGYAARAPIQADMAGSEANCSVAAMRVLVAEDNEFNAQLLEALLTRLGHRVQVAENGLEALELASNETFDLLLLDIHMPRLDGFGVARRIREREAISGGHLPIIAITARSRKEDRDLCIAAGMDDFLVKPLRAADLRAAMDRITTGKPTTPSLLPSTQSDATVFDPATLVAACGRHEKMLHKVITSLRTHLPEQLAALHDAIRNDDALQIREAAHKLAGIVAAFSTLATSTALDLEDAAAANRLQDVDSLTSRLDDLCHRLLQELEGVSISALIQHVDGV